MGKGWRVQVDGGLKLLIVHECDIDQLSIDISIYNVCTFVVAEWLRCRTFDPKLSNVTAVSFMEWSVDQGFDSYSWQ